MCPPAQTASAAEIDKYWTDEGLFKSLMEYQSGCPLPLNVTSDVNPYKYKPSRLSEELWYFCSSVENDAENGFWMAIGEGCEIFLDSGVIGLRTTRQFYEGQAPNGQKTNWMMQEYTTTDKRNSKLDHRALCRVFLVDIDVTNSVDLGPKIASDVNTSGQLSKIEPLEKNMDDGPDPLAVAQRSPDPPLENSPDADYVLEGDYMELNDLAVPLSRTSSSADSSLTNRSEDFFDSIALLREIDDDTTDNEMKDSGVKFNLSASLKPIGVVIPPSASGCLKDGEECKPSTEETLQVDHTRRYEQEESSSSSEGTSKEEKKDHVGRTKRRKLMKYLCFMAF